MSRRVSFEHEIWGLDTALEESGGAGRRLVDCEVRRLLFDFTLGLRPHEPCLENSYRSACFLVSLDANLLAERRFFAPDTSLVDSKNIELSVPRLQCLLEAPDDDILDVVVVRWPSESGRLTPDMGFGMAAACEEVSGHAGPKQESCVHG